MHAAPIFACSPLFACTPLGCIQTPFCIQPPFCIQSPICMHPVQSLARALVVVQGQAQVQVLRVALCCLSFL